MDELVPGSAPHNDHLFGAPAFEKLTPYQSFDKEAWSRLRFDTPLTLSPEEIKSFQSMNDPVSLDEVKAVYLPVSRLLRLYVSATQELFRATKQFLKTNGHKTPFILGVAGSVAVGKSTTARILQALMGRWPGQPKVDLVTTDCFLLPNAELMRRNILNRKGFPESYDFSRLLRFLTDIKAGSHHLKTPVYSHLFYDILPDEFIEVDQPDILIIEGLNVLQPARLPKDGRGIPYVSDFIDFSIYIHSDEDILEKWYVERFMKLCKTAFLNPDSYFHRFADLTEQQAIETAVSIWRQINLVNLHRNILPTRQRADLILNKGADHGVNLVELRKL